jgi:hypothetical protein
MHMAGYCIDASDRYMHMAGYCIDASDRYMHMAVRHQSPLPPSVASFAIDHPS